MTRKEKWTITILAIILAALTVALVIVLATRHREARTAENSTAWTSGGIPAAQDIYTALTYRNGSATLSFSLDETDAWIWADDPDFPLDSGSISAILDALSGLVPQQVLSEPDTLDSYGLDDPVTTLTAVTAEQETVRLDFGKATTDGASYYALMNGDETTVYIFPGTLYDLLQVPIYDMMDLPSLPSLTEDTLLSISIRGAAGENGEAGLLTTLTAQRSGEGEASSVWRSGGADVTDSATVQALLEDLASLSVTKCIDYRPSDEAAIICGFDAPAAQVSISYQANGMEQTLTLTIGNAVTDGRYVRFDEDPTIYLLSTSLLDPLMRVSANGLD